MSSLILPSNHFMPLYTSDIGDDAIALAAICGLYLDDWQQEIVRGLVSPNESGRLAARKALLLIPRQQGKNICIEARELAGLFLLEEKIMLHTAHEFATAQSSFRRLREHIENAQDILPNGRKVGYRDSGQETSIRIPAVKSGPNKRGSSYLKFAPRTGGAGRGLTVEFLVVDEAYHYTSEKASALEFTQNQSKNPQIVYTSSTGFPESLELMALRELGMSHELDNFMYVEFKADDGCDPGDEEQWFKALPGLRTGRQNIEEVRAHYLKASKLGDMTDFNREMLGLWATVDLPSLIPAGLWESMQFPPDFEWEPPEEFAFAVDVSPDSPGLGQVASIYAAGADEYGFHHVWNVGSDEGIMWVPEFLKIAQERYGPRVTVIDPMSSAGALLPMLDDAEVQYTTLRSQQCMAACSQFYAYARDGKLRHGEDSLLAEAVDSGIQRWVGQKGAWLWARKNMDDNITPLVAATYALFGLTGVDPAEEETGGWFW